jgi:DNA-binding PadR family transcriptional regulator
MPIQHAVLALLGNEPSHGYELKGAFEAAVGPQWGPLNIGHLYQVLERLSRDGLVTSTRVEQTVKPDRVVYAITKAGQLELDQWMSAPTPRTSGFRDDFFLKMVAAAHTRRADVLSAVLRAQRKFLLQEMRNLEKLRRERTEDILVGLLLATASRHVNADLAFLDDIEAALLADDGAGLTAFAEQLQARRPRRDAERRPGHERHSDQERRAAG